MSSQNYAGHRSRSPTFSFGLSNAIAAEASAAASFSFGLSDETADVPSFSFASVNVHPPSAVVAGQQDAKAADASSGDSTASARDVGPDRNSAQDLATDEPLKAKKRRVHVDSSSASSQDQPSESKQMVAPSSEFGVGMLELMRSVCGASPFGHTVYNGLQQVVQTMATRLSDADQKAWEQAFAKQFVRPARVSMWQSGKIPDVALQNIMSFLAPSTLLKAWELVCRRWRGVSLSGWIDYHEMYDSGCQSYEYNNWKNAPVPGEQPRLAIMDPTWNSGYRLQKLQTRIAGKVQRFSIRSSYIDIRVLDTLQCIGHYLSRVREFHFSIAVITPAEITTLKFCIEHMPHCHTLQLSNADYRTGIPSFPEMTMWSEVLPIIRRSSVRQLTLFDFPTVPVHECFRIRASEPPTHLTHVAFLTTRSVAHDKRYSIRTKAWRHVLDNKSNWEPCKTIRSIRIVLADGRVHPFFIFIGYNCPNLTDLDLQCGGFKCDSLVRDYKRWVVPPASSLATFVGTSTAKSAASVTDTASSSVPAATNGTPSTTVASHASQPTATTQATSGPPSTHSPPKKTHVLQYHFQHLRISSFTKQAFGRAETAIDYGVPAYDPRQFFWMIGMRRNRDAHVSSGDGGDVDRLLSNRGAGQGDKDGVMSLDSGSSAGSGAATAATADVGATSSSAPISDSLGDTSDSGSVEDGDDDDDDDDESDSDDANKNDGKDRHDINDFTNLLQNAVSSQLRTVQLDVPIHLPRISGAGGRLGFHTVVSLDDQGVFVAPLPATVDARDVDADAKRPGCELCSSTADERYAYSTTQEDQSLEDRCIRGWNSLQDVELNMVISNHTPEPVSSSSFLDWSFAVDQMQRWSRLTRVRKLSLTIDKNVITQIDGAVIMTLQNFACIERVQELTIVGHGIAMPNMASLYRKLTSVHKFISHKPPPRSQELLAAGTYMQHLTDWTWFTPRSLRECVPDVVDFLDRTKNYKPPLLKVLRLMLLVTEPPERTRTIGSVYLRQNMTRTAHALQATQIDDMEQVKLQSAGMAAGVVIYVSILDTSSSHVTSVV